MPIQIPPAVGSSGQFIESIIVTSSQHRHAMVIGDAFSTALLTVSSSGGLAVFLTNPLAILAGGTVFTLSSGPIVLSSNPVAGQVVSLSSGTVTVANPSTAVNVANSPTVLTASSGYLVRSLSSGTVTLSSNPTVVLSSIPSLSSGTVTLSSAPLVIVATSGGTIPVTLSTVFSLSSNPTVVSASSGVIQLSSQITVTAQMSTATGSGITSTYKLLTTITAVKTAAGRLMGFSAYTTVHLGGWIQFYDMTTGNVTVGTSMTMSVPIGAWTTLAYSTGVGAVAGILTVGMPDPVWFGPNGINFATAISANCSVTASGATLSTGAGGNITGVACTFFYV